MSYTRLRDFAPTLPENSPFLSPGILSLAAMAAATRNARVLLAEVLHGLPGEELARLLQIMDPNLTDKQVAGLCGVSVDEVGGWQHYQRLKLRLDGLATKRRRCRPADERSAASPGDDPFLSMAILGLAAMPRKLRQSRLLLLDFINRLPGEELAMLALLVQPHLNDEVIADLTGVTLRNVYRWDRYRWLKPTLADYFKRGSKRRWYYLIERFAALVRRENTRSQKFHAAS